MIIDKGSHIPANTFPRIFQITLLFCPESKKNSLSEIRCFIFFPLFLSHDPFSNPPKIAFFMILKVYSQRDSTNCTDNIISGMTDIEKNVSVIRKKWFSTCSLFYQDFLTQTRKFYIFVSIIAPTNDALFHWHVPELLSILSRFHCLSFAGLPFLLTGASSISSRKRDGSIFFPNRSSTE